MTKRAGKQRPIGLGSARDVSLKDARELAEACRRALHLGRDPKSVLAEAAGELTFEAAARELIDSMAPGWRNAKHSAQWRMTLLGEMSDKDGCTKKTRYDYCAAIRNKPVSNLTTEDALRVLKPLWQTRPETANRCVAAASAYGTLPRRAVIAPGKIRSGGAGIWTSCYRSARDYRVATIKRCRSPTFRRS
jgi:hypothetical protein